MLAMASTSACTTHLFSPPARMIPLETVATLPAGRAGVAVEGGIGGGIFGPGVTMGTVRLRRGLVENLDVSVEGNLLILDWAHLAPSAHLGVKWRAASFLAVTMGLGGGASEASGFLSPDLGLTFAYENPYFIPFFTARIWTSSPFAVRTLTLPINDNEGAMTAQFRTAFTFGTTLTVGFRVPVATDANGFVRGALALGVSGYSIQDATDEDGGFLLNVGGEHMF